MEYQPDDDVKGQPKAAKHHKGFVEAVVGNSHCDPFYLFQTQQGQNALVPDLRAYENIREDCYMAGGADP